MKKIYECPTIEVVALDQSDIIVMSIPSGSPEIEDMVFGKYNEL